MNISNKVQIYNHVRKHGGYIVGENAKGALKIAKLAVLAEELGLEVKWEYEEQHWSEYTGDAMPQAYWEKQFSEGRYECLFAYVEDSDGNVLASLGGIILGIDDRDSRLNYEYELLAEAIQTLKLGA